MNKDTLVKRIDSVDVNDLYTKYHNLRIGEEIQCMKVKDVKRIVDPAANDNLSGTNYKYL